MRRASRRPDRALGGEAGSASVEFLLVGLGLLLPLVYLVFVVGAVQSGALAVEGAARGAARAAVVAPSAPAGRAAAQNVVTVALDDVGLEPRSDVALRCAPDPGRCVEPNSRVTVTVSAVVPLPLLPHLFGLGALTDVPITATATATVSRFAGQTR